MRTSARRMAGALLIVGALLSASACSSSESTDTGSAEASAAPSAAGEAASGSPAAGGDESFDIVMIPGTAGDEFYHTAVLGAQEKAAELGVNLEVQLPAKFDPAAQIPILQAAIIKKPDAIIISPVDSKALVAPIKEAVDAGIKVITMDTTIDDASLLTSYVSNDNIQAGQAIGEALAGLMGDAGKALFISVAPGVSTTDDWIEGYTQVMNGKSDVEQLPVQYSDNEETKAAQIMTATLQANPDLAGVFLGNLVSARGAVTGLKQADMVGKLATVAFDATPTQVADLKAGVIDALVSVPALGEGSTAVETAVKALNGEAVEPVIALENCTITADNVDSAEVRPCLYQPLDS